MLLTVVPWRLRSPTPLAHPVLTGSANTMPLSLLGHPLRTVFASVDLSPDLTVTL